MKCIAHTEPSQTRKEYYWGLGQHFVALGWQDNWPLILCDKKIIHGLELKKKKTEL